MTFTVTACGDEFDTRFPNPEHVRPLTVAWHLSQINRFTGAAIRPYSVAEHSLLVAEIAEREFHLPAVGQLLALLHDAHEAFLGDLATPWKHEVGDEWRRAEQRLERLLRRRFGLEVATVVHAEAVRKADLLALASERAALLPSSPTPWLQLDGVLPLAWAVHDLQQPARRAHDWEFWRDRFLDRFHELDFARSEGRHPVTPFD